MNHRETDLIEAPGETPTMTDSPFPLARDTINRVVRRLRQEPG